MTTRDELGSFDFLAPRLPPRMMPGSEPVRPSAIGRYRIKRLLACGGQGIVYLAEDPELSRAVVIKTLRHAGLDPHGLTRLRREARLSGRIDHPAVCPVLDVLAQDGVDYVIMPFLDGETLQERISRGRRRTGGDSRVPFPDVEPDSEMNPSGAMPENAARREGSTSTNDLRSVIRFMETVATAVHAAHEHGVIHRDLKPGNIIIKKNGEPVVLDFGLALDTSMRTHITQTGTAIGTPAYMAPEQVNGELDAIDRTTDVYALGVMLYELLAGRLPYEGRSVQELFLQILTGAPMLPREDQS